MEATITPDKQVKNRGKATQWQSGQSGNPKGRPPKNISLTSELKEQLNQVCPHDPQRRTWLQYLVARWLGQAAENATYFRELIERLEGKVTQTIESEGGLATVNINVNSNDTKTNIESVISQLSSN